MKDALPARRGEPFFWRMGLLLAALVIAGFVPPVFQRPGGVSTVPLLLHVHGALVFGWFLLFVTQARLIGAGQLRLHRAFGLSSIVLAAAIVVVGYYVIAHAYARPGFSIAGGSPAASVMFPFTDLVNFSIVYALGVSNRHRPNAHKRLMLLAGILIMDPAVARLVMTLGGPPPLILLIELGLFAALFVYDVRRLRRPHWTSLLGLGLFIAAMAAKIAAAPTPGWAGIVEVLFAR